jgi:acetolactate synthase-1/2/3 large subunit
VNVSVAAMLAQALADAGVRWAFTVPGESFLPLLDALPGVGIRVVPTRHEGGASFMAEAIGNLTGRPAAVLGTRAVGASNMAIGIHTARANSTPLVALLGQVGRPFRGREAFQEVELTETFGGLAKWAAELTDPERAADVVGEGLRAMTTGRPGPVLFSLPEDMLDEWLLEGARADVTPPSPAPPSDASVAAVVALLAQAERPAILAGGGARRAGWPMLIELAERLGAPVFAAWRRPDAFPHDHANFLGVTGYGAPATVRARLLAADALLVLGCRLNEIASFGYSVPGEGTRWAHVDLAPRSAHAGLSAPDVALAADASAFLAMAAEQVRRLKAPTKRRRALAADRAAFLAASATVIEEDWHGPGVQPAQVVATLQQLLPADAILTTDAGNFGLWPARHYRFTRPGTFLGPTSGAMGYGLPAAIAAALAEPERVVVALSGDGGFAMTMNELETAVREGTRLVALVFDNRRYGTIAMHQQRAGLAETATELGAIDFAAVARACGAQGGRVTRDAELVPALRDALDADRPAVITLEVDPRWVSPDFFDAAD